MNASKILMSALLALCLTGAGCNRANKVVVTVKSQPTTPMELKLKWPLGRHGVQTMEMDMTSVTTVPSMGRSQPAQTMTNDMTVGQQVALTVTKELDAGQREVEMAYLSTKMASTMNGKTLLAFDSTQKPDTTTDPLAATLGKMVGAKIQFTLDASNVVVAVAGVDELQNRLEGVTKADPTGMLKNLLNEDSLKRNLDFARYLPGKPVQPGDTWPVQQKFSMGPLGTMVANFTYTLNGWEQSHGRWCARIGIDGTLQTQPGDNPDSPIKGMKFTITNGTCSGETWFDLDLGMFVDMTLDQDMKVSVTMPLPAPRQTGANTPVLPKTMNISGDVHQTITTKYELK